MRAAGIVLAGGRSSRMGAPKAALTWHGSTLLHRTAAVLARSVPGPVVVVAAPGQDLPALPARTEVLADPVEGLGPLSGVGTGLAALAGRADAAFVCATDVPFLHPAFIRRVLNGLAESGAELLLPFARGYRQPLTAAYRVSLAGRIAGLLATGERRLGVLPEHCTVTRLDDTALLADPALAAHDPELASVINVNTPEEYASARRRPPPRITLGGAPAAAATLGAAAALAGVPPQRCTVHGVAGTDPLLPLVAGDVVTWAGAPSW